MITNKEKLLYVDEKIILELKCVKVIENVQYIVKN